MEPALALALEHLPATERATLLRLEVISGATRLQSANPASDMPGGPAINVTWAFLRSHQPRPEQS